MRKKKIIFPTHADLKFIKGMKTGYVSQKHRIYTKIQYETHGGLNPMTHRV